MLGVLAVSKAMAVAALLAGAVLNFLPGNAWNYIVYSRASAGPPLAFVNWDAQHYLALALGGYPVPAGPSTAFFPLFPALVALLVAAGLGPIAAGLTVVTLCSAAVLLLLDRLLPDERSADSSLWLFASFPTAFYLSVVYAEALFLALLLGLMWSLRDARRAGYAFACAAALPLARGEGLWLALPLAVAWAAARLARSPLPALAGRSLSRAALGYLLGVAAYFAFYAAHYGDPLAGIRAQQYFVFHNSVANLFDLPRFLGFLFSPPAAFLAYNNAGLDKAMIVVSLLALGLGARYAAKDPFLLAAWACFAVLPALMGEGGSYARHALLAWACFVIAAGAALRPWLKWGLVAAGLPLQIWLAWQFGGNHWVG